VLEVVEALDGTLGADAEEAGPVWVDAVEALRKQLRDVTIADVAEREASAAGASMYYI